MAPGRGAAVAVHDIESIEVNDEKSYGFPGHRRVLRDRVELGTMAGVCDGRRAVAAAPRLYDWTTDGGDNQRTGWNKNEKTLTRDNVKNLKLLWKLHTDNPVRALHSLMPVLVLGQLKTTAGTKQVGYVSGISDNLYAFEVETGKILWQKHWDYPPPAARRRRGRARE